MPDAEICEACGVEFGCGAREGGCWCDEATVPAGMLAQLRERHDRCLCPGCLRAAALSEPAA